MFHTIVNAVAGFSRANLRNIILTGAAMACIPTAASARHPSYHLDVVVPPPVVYVEQACAPARLWIEPVYQNVSEQVWVPAITKTQIQRVDIPAEYGWRDVVSYDFFSRPHRFRQQVMLSPAHCEDRTVQVVVCPGHFEQQTHQQLICEGHWQEVATPISVVRPVFRIRFPLPF